MSKEDQLRVTVANGKYTVVMCAGRLTALRYGEAWRECVGDNLVLALAQEVRDLRELLTEVLRCESRELPAFHPPGEFDEPPTTMAQTEYVCPACNARGVTPDVGHTEACVFLRIREALK